MSWVQRWVFTSLAIIAILPVAELRAGPSPAGATAPVAGERHTLAGGASIRVDRRADVAGPQLLLLEQLSLDSVIACGEQLYNAPTARVGIEAVVLQPGQHCEVRPKQAQAVAGTVQIAVLDVAAAPLGLDAERWRDYAGLLALDLEIAPQRSAALAQLDRWLAEDSLAAVPRMWFGLARAQLRRRAGQHVEALQDYAATLQQATALGRPDILPTVHNSAGQSALALGQGEMARAHFQQALDGARALQRNADAAAAHNNLCLVLQHEDQLEQASRCYAEAVAAFAAAGEVEQGTVARSNQAYVAQRAGDPQTALDALQAVLDVRRHGPDRRALGLTHLKLAQLHLQTGRFDAALAQAEAALALARERADPNDTAIARRQLAAVLAAVHQPARALAYLEQAATEATQPDILTGILIDHAQLLPRGEWSLALREQALGLLGGRGARVVEHGVRIEQARDWTALGRQAQARAALAALREELPVGDDGRWARWWLAQAEAAAEAADAGRHAAQAVTAYRRLGDPEGELQALVLQARAHLDQGRRTQALTLLSRVAALHARLLGAAPGPALAASLQMRQRVWLPLLLEAAQAAGTDPAAAEQLWQAWNQAVTTPQYAPHGPAEDWQRYRLLAAQLREVTPLTATRRSAWLRELDQLERSLQGRASALSGPRLAQWQARLQPGQVLQRYALGPQRSWLWQVQAERIEVLPLPPVEALLAQLAAARRDADSAAALARTLWSAVPDATRRVWVLPDPRMQDWPYPALMLQRGAAPIPVAVVHAGRLPAATAGARLPADFSVLDVGLPAVRPLPGALRARRLLQSRLGPRYQAHAYLGEALPAAQVLHLAAHGWHHPAFPGAAALGGDRPGSAGLTVGVADLILERAPQLIVLSSCEAAAADDWGSGQSLARNFADHHAAVVIAPTEPVDDALAMHLDQSLFTALQTEEPAAALLTALQQLPPDRRQVLTPWQVLEALGEVESL